MLATEVVDAVYRALSVAKAEHPNVPAFNFQLSLDGDHNSNEIILTDRDGTDWVISSKTLKELEPD